jgi:hypothetical protein
MARYKVEVCQLYNESVRKFEEKVLAQSRGLKKPIGEDLEYMYKKMNPETGRTDSASQMRMEKANYGMKKYRR